MIKTPSLRVYPINCKEGGFSLHLAVLLFIILSFRPIFRHKILIRRFSSDKHHSSCSIRNRIEEIPPFIDEYPSSLHSGIFVHIEPAPITGIIGKSNTQISLLIKCIPASVDQFPLMLNRLHIIVLSHDHLSCRITAIAVSQPPAILILHPMAVSIVYRFVRSARDNSLYRINISFFTVTADIRLSFTDLRFGRV